MVSKTREKSRILFDDTPLGLLEMLVFVGGFVAILSISPALIAALGGIGYMIKADDRLRRQKLQKSFSYLKSKGYIYVRKRRKKLHVEVTAQGMERARAARLRNILSEPMLRPPTWDHMWRLIIFDISAGERAKRNAFRSFIKQTGAIMLQKSVWVYPFDCTERIELLRSFFGFSESELRLVITNSLGNDRQLRKHFKC